MNASESHEVKPAGGTGPDGPSSGRFYGLAGLVVVVVVVAAVAGLLPRRHQRTALAAEQDGKAVPGVIVVMPEPNRGGGGVSIPADIKPWVEASIHDRASGFVKRWLVDMDGKVEMWTVKLGRDFGQIVEILGGVNPTNQVIVNPPDSLASGTTVRVAEVVKLETFMPAQGMPGGGRPGQGMPGAGMGKPEMSGQGTPGQGMRGEGMPGAGKGEPGKGKREQ